ncbi:MAG: acyltransferase family protein [Lachnospiraceae bacterium]|nr:acyltransferase family protein [Lachnospiraceae bacterium]
MKKDSATLQGVAILLMLYHHFFNDLSIYGGAFSTRWPQLVIYFAWFGKICVGTFAFVSGYGTCRQLAAKKDLKESFLLCIKQAFGLLVRFWVVLLLFVGLFLLLGKREWKPEEFIKNIACLEYTYNGAHWYVGQYVKMMLLLPIFDWFFRKTEEKSEQKKRWIFLSVCAAVGVILMCAALLSVVVRGYLIVAVKWLRPAFLLVFFIGYLLARFAVFEELFRRTDKFAKWIRVFAGIAVLAGVILVRGALADSAAYATLDFLFVPVFITGLLLILRDGGFLEKGLGWVGGMTAYLWLTHLFIYDLSKDMILKVTDRITLFYLAEVLLCIVIAWIMKMLDRTIMKMIKK